jgi:hypothetical protein
MSLQSYFDEAGFAGRRRELLVDAFAYLNGITDLAYARQRERDREGVHMAGRFVYWMNVSLDLFIEREAGEHSDIEGPSWVRLGEPLHREFSARARTMSMMVEGRTVYEMMDPFWPNARTDESLPRRPWTSWSRRGEAGHGVALAAGGQAAPARWPDPEAGGREKRVVEVVLSLVRMTFSPKSGPAAGSTKER